MWIPAKQRNGFTLIELLVTIGLIALLAGLLAPVLMQARRRSQEATCVSNLRQIGQAFRLYTDDYALRPPWLDRLAPNYIGDSRLFRCPADAWVADGGWAWSAWGQFNKPAPPWKMPISYGYFVTPVVVNTWLWEDLERQPGRPGYVVDVLHGDQVGPSMSSSAAPHFQGRILRLCFDGSVIAKDVRYRMRFDSQALLTQ